MVSKQLCCRFYSFALELVVEMSTKDLEKRAVGFDDALLFSHNKRQTHRGFRMCATSDFAVSEVDLQAISNWY